MRVGRPRAGFKVQCSSLPERCFQPVRKIGTGAGTVWLGPAILVAGLAVLVTCLGCEPESTASFASFETVSGGLAGLPTAGSGPAMAIDAEDQIYVVDMTARIQVFRSDGRLRAWSTPDHQFGKPTGLSVGIDGRILVADTHYYRIPIYSPEGLLVQTIGGVQGERPGEFGLVTDAVQDSQGNYYVSEYGEYDRIQKFSPSGQFLAEWGGHGSEPGRFMRPQNLAVDEKDHVWVADACNHRIQEFDSQGRFLQMWGTQGGAAGELHYPYDLVLDSPGTVLVAEFGNHRVQRFTRDGRSLGVWGVQGRGEGQLYNPWALVQDHQGRIHVLDTNNHRVQVIRPHAANR